MAPSILPFGPALARRHLRTLITRRRRRSVLARATGVTTAHSAVERLLLGNAQLIQPRLKHQDAWWEEVARVEQQKLQSAAGNTLESDNVQVSSTKLETDNDQVSSFDNRLFPHSVQANLEQVEQQQQGSIKIDPSKRYILRCIGYSIMHQPGVGVGIQVMLDNGANGSSHDELTTAPTEVTLAKLKVAELKVECKQRGLRVGGRKAELVERILAHDASEEPEKELNNMVVASKYLAGRSQPPFSADYTALLFGLAYCSRVLGIRHVVCETNSVRLEKSFHHPEANTSLKEKVISLIRDELDSFSLVQTEDALPHSKEIYYKDTTVHAESIMEPVALLAQHALATGKSLNWDHNDPLFNEDPMPMNKARMASAHRPIFCDDSTVAAIDPSKHYLLQFDGGTRGICTNERGDQRRVKTGCGMVLFEMEDQSSSDERRTEVWCGWKYLDKPAVRHESAELHALLLGLLCAKSLGVTQVQAQGDSPLVLYWDADHVYDHPELQQLFQAIQQSAAQFEDFELEHIDRSKTLRADFLVNHAMDTESSHGLLEKLHEKKAQRARGTTQEAESSHGFVEKLHQRKAQRTRGTTQEVSYKGLVW